MKYKVIGQFNHVLSGELMFNVKRTFESGGVDYVVLTESEKLTLVDQQYYGILDLHIDKQVKAYEDFKQHFKDNKLSLESDYKFTEFIASSISNSWDFDREGNWLSSYSND